MNEKEPFNLPFPPQADETWDDLIINDMKLLQSREGYRFSLDAVLLAQWLSLEKVSRGLDLGTGSGVMLLLLAARQASLELDGLEIQPALARRAQRNVANQGLSERIRIVQGDILQATNLFPKHSYDLVLSNPPFFRVGEGKVSPQPEKAVARHELLVTLADIVSTAHDLLRPEGTLALILRASRLEELLWLLHQQGFALRRLRLVHPQAQKAATMLLAEAVKKKKTTLSIEPPLMVYQEDGNYSEEIRTWYGK